MHPPTLHYDCLDGPSGPKEYACDRLNASTIETNQVAE
jgi:hypothetical protein